MSSNFTLIIDIIFCQDISILITSNIVLVFMNITQDPKMKSRPIKQELTLQARV